MPHAAAANREPTAIPPAVEVRQFRQIVFWPLLIQVPPEPVASRDGDWRESFREFLRKSECPWVPQDDLLVREGAGLNRAQYAEFVYFHPFVQRFLYGAPGQDADRAIDLYRRTDIDAVEVTLAHGSLALRLSVERMHLYVFETRMAMLVVEVFFDNRKERRSLQDFECLMDVFRRVYPPYFHQESSAGHCPAGVVWRTKPAAGASALAGGGQADYADEQTHARFVATHRAPSVSQHWQALLHPLKPYPVERRGFSYQQIEDERMPLMAYLAVDDPRRLTRGDFIRLGLAEEAGASDTLPYAQAFLETFEKEHCYDRFWDPKAESGQDWHTTRYLCCGYAFVMIGEDRGFFTDAEGGGAAHFRHHYFQMGLVAHFHKAALLAMSDRTAQAVADYRAHPRNSAGEAEAFEGLCRDMQRILQEFLQFTHRYWFAEMSNQVQARELFALWTRHLGTQSLFDQVKQEIQEAHGFLSGLRQDKLGRSANDLAVFGIPIALAGLLASWFALSPVRALEGGQWKAALGDAAVSFLLSCGLLLSLGRGWGRLHRLWQAASNLSIGIAVLALALAILAIYLAEYDVLPQAFSWPSAWRIGAGR